MILYDRVKQLKIFFTRNQLAELGVPVIKKFRDTRGHDPVKIKVEFTNAKNKTAHWWLADYPADFLPEMDIIIKEKQASLKRKKRARIGQKVFTTSAPSKK